MRMLLAFLLAPVLVLIALLCVLVIIVPTKSKPERKGESPDEGF